MTWIILLILVTNDSIASLCGIVIFTDWNLLADSEQLLMTFITKMVLLRWKQEGFLDENDVFDNYHALLIGMEAPWEGFLNFYLLLYLVGDTNFHLLAYSLTPCNSPGLARLKPGVTKSIQVSFISGSNITTWTITCCLWGCAVAKCLNWRHSWGKELILQYGMQKSQVRILAPNAYLERKNFTMLWSLMYL